MTPRHPDDEDYKPDRYDSDDMLGQELAEMIEENKRAFGGRG